MERQTIPGLALVAAERWPDGNAVTCGDVRLSFAELADRMMAAAAAFVAAGLQPGERVCLWAENGWRWIVACLGLQAAGGVLVPLNTRFRAVEATYIVNRSEAAMAVASETFLGVSYADMLDALDAPSLRRVVRLGEADWAAFLAAADPAARAEAERRVRALRPDDVSDIMFTSGTTGDPKGAVATHGQTVATGRLWVTATTLRAGDRFLILWPFFHCSGYKAGWVVDLLVGAATLPEPVLDAGPLLDKVAREEVTFLPGPPTLFQTLLADPALDRAKLASVRVSITGASAVPPSLIEAMRRDLGIPVVLSGYGLTETCGTVTMTSADDPPEIVTTSCGRAIDGIELVCVDQAGHAVPTGEPGEVLVRGMNVMKGYLDDPAATAEAIDPDGWLHTGDIGTLDARGYLRITDRKKDIFIVGGFNCYPAEIEKMLLAHPAILQVAVTGIPDERMGEVGKAFVVLKPGAALDRDTLTAWSRERMANFKVPRVIAFVSDLPTNATGKVQKFKLPGGSGAMHDISRTIARTLAHPAEGEALAYRGRWRSWRWLSAAAGAIDGAVGDAPAVGIVARNRPHHVAAYAANLAAGRATAMLYAAQTATGLAADIERVRLPAIVADAEDWSPEALAAAAAAGTAAIATCDDGDGVAVTVLGKARLDASFRSVAGTVALELLSSGTTGMPKRLPLSWDAIAQVVESSATAYAGSGVPAPQVMVHPLGNVAGLAYATPPLALATPLVLLDRFEAVAWAEAVRDYRPVRGTIPPVGVRMLLESQVPRDWLASLTLIAVGGARLDVAQQVAFEARFGIPLLTAYGATEFGGVIANWSLPDYREWGTRKRGSAGRPSRGAAIRIVDPADGQPVAPGLPGILEAQVARIGDGWIRTNDLASLDTDGFLFLHGRADDAINRGGFKIVPEVVAAALRAHPAVAEAAVIGRADARLGEVPVAAVELVPAAGVAPEDLRTWLKDRLVAYQVPVEIRIVDALPRNASLKVALADVRALFA